ncbi:MAG TPA: response regulator, partial [Isosphaeraceae bacterium]
MARILVVEDEDKVRQALQRGLEEQGYAVVAVGDGDEGLARAAAGAFDCLILDWMLPGRDGLRVVQELRAAGVRTPALILTARGAVEDRVRGLDGGADDYL